MNIYQPISSALACNLFSAESPLCSVAEPRRNAVLIPPIRPGRRVGPSIRHVGEPSLRKASVNAAGASSERIHRGPAGENSSFS